MKKKVCVLFSILLLFLPVLGAEVISEFSFTIDANNKMLAYGEVAGVSGYYIIDTGCTTQNILFEQIQNMREIAGDSGEQWAIGTTFRSPVYETEQLKFENAVYKGNFQFIQVPDTIRNLFSSEIKGIINPCAIEGIIEISFTDRKIRLRDDVPPVYTESIGYETKQSINFIPINVNDTGSYGQLGFPVSALNNLPQLELFKNYFGVAVSADNVATNYNNYYAFKLHSFTLFNHTYTNVALKTSTLADNNDFGVIGIDVLKNYDIIFVPSEQKLYYRPRLPDFFYDIFFSHESYGSGLGSIDYNPEGSLTLKEIVYLGPAWKKGLRPGYKITKVNSINAADIPVSSLVATLQSRSVLKIEFLDEEKNKTRTVYIYPKKLLK